MFLFGFPAVRVILASLCAALIAEVASSALFRRFTLGDGSAFLTGLLVGLLMPAGVPLYVPAAAAAFAILVVKQSFGGLGRNWMNPALGGVVFALLSWSSSMTRWAPVGDASAGTAAVPPLEALRSWLVGFGRGRETSGCPCEPRICLQRPGREDRFLAQRAHTFADPCRPWPQVLSTFSSGTCPGRIGEVSAPLLLLGAAFLVSRRIVRWQVPVAYVGSFALLTLVFGGFAGGQGWFSGGALFHVLSGSLILGAFFMAGDPVTSPLAPTGKWIYGIGLGLFTFLLRFYGALGDGVAVSVLLGNCAVPFLDRLLQPRAPAGAREGSA